jgi:hypothetical protein
MFGHQDNQSTGQSDQPGQANDSQDNTTTTILDPAANNSSGTGPIPDASLGSTTDLDSPKPTEDQTWQHPGQAIDDSASQKDDAVSPAGGFPQALSSKEPAISPTQMISAHAHPSIDDNKLTDATNDDLLEVKEKALGELFPLIDKLDQTPEEHFKTLMMIIQASDNQTLVEQAYQVAQTIDDEKVRAQALLDIVNEINYFTQQPKI